MPADDPRLFAGWYENDQCVSREEELIGESWGMVDRSLRLVSSTMDLWLLTAVMSS